MQEEIEVSTKIKVDPDFVEFLLDFSDIFATSHSGYWALGLKHSRNKTDPAAIRGWLVVEQDEDGASSDAQRAVFPEAERAWQAKEPLPPQFFSLDETTALDIIRAGVKRYGPNFQKEYDSVSLDVAIQEALLGEVRYG